MRAYGHVERAELARLKGDEAERERWLRSARTMFEEMGSKRRIEELDEALR